VIRAVVFDLDGVIVDSEQVWVEVREQYVRGLGLDYPVEATRAMMGMSSPEWSGYLAESLGVPGSPGEINDAIVERMLVRYGTGPPLIPGAVEAVRRMAERWPLGIASSSNPELIEAVVQAAGIEAVVRVALSSEEVGRGKPAPDVYLEAVRRLGVEPADAAAIEDSEPGLRSAKAAGLRVIAVPNLHFPPHEEALALADVVLATIDELTADVVEPAS
jgi:beta-phosphoglucomutase-like phosphatase (HAD superfamily)